MVHDMMSRSSEFLNSGNTNNDKIRHHRRPSVMPSLSVIIHPFQLPARWNLTKPNNFI
jgi:hypothetical protein